MPEQQKGKFLKIFEPQILKAVVYCETINWAMSACIRSVG
uniref:Uncharacterized protein n=1 Tax=Anguilla anguilla TaxID=7936 RepID=A0A0E9UZE7_ANGAN